MTRTGSERHHETGVDRSGWMQECQRATTGETGTRLRVHTRSAAPEFGTREYHDTVIDLVRDLEEQGSVDRVEFDVWGKHVGTSPATRTDQWTTPTVEAYRSWADRHDVTLPFEERQCNSMLIDESYTVLVPPHLLVAVCDEDGDVLGIAPSVDADGPTSVMDLLTTLRDAGQRDDQLASASA